MGFSNGSVVTATLSGSLSSVVSGSSQGSQQNNQTQNLQLNSDKQLEVSIRDPLGAFGELITAELVPRIQLDAIYGILDTDVEVLTGSNGLAYANSGSIFICESSNTPGSYGVIRSRRLVRYRPGQGIRARFTARWPSSASQSLVAAGLFNAEDGLFVGYNGTSFGFLRRIAGSTHISRLTLTAGTGASPETVTITLNGVTGSLVIPANQSAANTSFRIATSGSVFTAWSSGVSPRSNNGFVTFLQNIPGPATGTFGITSTGTASGTFAHLQTGSANDEISGFIPQESWNVDTYDGSGNASNPSGVLLDPTKINIFEIVYPFLGAGSIKLRVMSPSGKLNTAHVVQYPNSNVLPSQKNPTFRLGWIAASLGTTTPLSIEGISGYAANEGQLYSARDPFAVSVRNITVTTTSTPYLLLRIRSEFARKTCQREVLLNQVIVGCETTSRIIVASIVLNPVLTGLPIFSYVRESTSVVEYSTTATTYTGGTLLAESLATAGAPTSLNLKDLETRFEAGDILAVVLTSTTSTATAAVAVNWQER
jgi:hypothetical protein